MAYQPAPSQKNQAGTLNRGTRLNRRHIGENPLRINSTGTGSPWVSVETAAQTEDE
jgi:hypothetical protein